MHRVVGAAPVDLGPGLGQRIVLLKSRDVQGASTVIRGRRRLLSRRIRWKSKGLLRWLSMMVQRLLAACAVMAAGIGAAVPTAAASQLDAPDTPASVSLSRADGAVTAAWPAAARATSYHVTYSTDGRASWSLAALDHPAVEGENSITIDDADNTKTYVVAVRARNEAGGSGWRNSAAAGPWTPPDTTPAPATPSSVSLSRADGAVTAAWPAAAHATSYHVTYSTNGKASWQFVVLDHPAVEGENSITIDDADNTKTYVVAVRARNEAGGSGWRNSAAAGPWTPPPTLVAGEATETTITMTLDNYSGQWWYRADEASGGGGAGASGAGAGAASGQSGCNGPVSGAQATASGLNPDTSYTLGAYANAQCSGGAIAAGAQMATMPVAPSQIAKPDVEPKRDSFKVSWSTPTGTVTVYQIQWRRCKVTWNVPTGIHTNDITVPCLGWAPWERRTVDDRDSNLTGVHHPATSKIVSDYIYAGVRYQARVRASHTTNTGGNWRTSWSPWSEPSDDVWPNPQPPSAPTITSVSAAAELEGNKALRVSWTAPTSDIADTGDLEYYNLRWCPDSTGCDQDSEWTQVAGAGVPHVEGTATYSTIVADSRLAGATLYQVQVRAISDAWNNSHDTADWWRLGGDWSESVTASPTAPAAPTGLKVVVGDLDATLSWGDPNNAAITGYQYRLNHNATSTGRFKGWSDWQDIANSDAVTTSHTFSGLAFQREYRYQLRAVDAVGPSAAAPNAAPWYVSAAMPGPSDPRPSHDFNTLSTAGNEHLDTIWSDGTTMWVTDYTDDKLYAYKMSDKTRDTAKDISLHTSNGDPVGIWSNGTTMWVSDLTTDKLYAYNMSTKARDSAKDFDTLSAATNNHAGGIWSDGTTMWVADSVDDKIYAYNMSTKARDSAKDFDTLSAAGNDAAYGLWSDGTTMWVSDNIDDKIYAYDLSTKARDSAKDFDTLIAATNEAPGGIWSNGTTMWVADTADKKLYAYYGYSPLAVSDVTASSATLTLGGHTGDWWIKQTAPRVRPCTAGEADYSHAVSRLTTGREYTYKAYSASGCGSGNELASATFTTKAPGDRNPAAEFNLETTNANSSYIWSNGTIMWVNDWNDKKLYAYNLSTKAYDSSNDIALRVGDDEPRGIWSDGTTMWVADDDDDVIYSYNLSAKSFNNGENITLDSSNQAPLGIWSDGTTMWVVNSTGGKVYAYKMSDKSRDTSQEFTLHSEHENPDSIWSDGNTIWILDFMDDTLYAYKMSDKSRDPSQDYTLDDTNDIPYGIWSDGTTMWVSDPGKDKLFAYYGFPALAVSDAAINSATVTLTGHAGDWWVKQTSPAAAGACAAGESDYSHALSGLTRDTEHTYTAYSASGCVSVDEIASATFTTLGVGEYNAAKDFNTLSGASNGNPRGLWSDGTTMWVADWSDEKIYAYKVSDMSRDASKDFDTLIGAGNQHPSGIWSDGTTMWVGDTADKKLYAYSMTSKARVSSNDIALHADNALPQGMWSDGTTMWVADASRDSIFAYTLSTKARDTSKGFNDLRSKGVDLPWGIWSDGTIMWVADREDDKVYAFDFANKSHYPPKDFDTLDAAGNNHPSGLWSDGTTMWVADTVDGKIYAYYAYPTLRASNVAAASATLTLAGHTGSWWIKQESPTSGACTAGEADYSHALSNLTASTAYAFEAYSKAGCNSADQIAAATFTTTP